MPRNTSRQPYVWMLTSRDDGATWSIYSKISENGNETSVYCFGGGKWLAVARTRQRTLEAFRSDDDGQSWKSAGEITGKDEINGHLTGLADGRLLLTYGDRNAAHPGVVVKCSADQGASWGNPLRICDTMHVDSGYPSSSQLPDGKIVTLWYSRRAVNHHRYHMGSAIWSADWPTP